MVLLPGQPAKPLLDQDKITKAKDGGRIEQRGILAVTLFQRRPFFRYNETRLGSSQ
jgi:hypothetical protein